MLHLFLTSLITFGLSSNIILNSGVGVLLFGREKKYRAFRYVNTLFLMLGIVICCTITYFLNRFVYEKFDFAEISVGVTVIFASIYNLIVSAIWKKSSFFGHYLYERSCSYVFDMVFIVYVSLTLNLSLDIVPYLLDVAAVIVVVFVMNLLVGFYLDSINKSTLKVYFRNVPARIFLIAIFAILFTYIGKLV